MKKFLVFSILLIALNACKKSDTKPVTKSDMLTSGTWMVTAVVSDDDGDGTYETNDFASFDACYTDNIWTFNSNGTMEMNEGATKCAPSDPQTETASWSLTNNETSLVMATDTYAIEQLDASKIILKLSYGSSSSKVTFSKR